jgi:hypothetical protein
VWQAAISEIMNTKFIIAFRVANTISQYPKLPTRTIHRGVYKAISSIPVTINCITVFFTMSISNFKLKTTISHLISTFRMV